MALLTLIEEQGIQGGILVMLFLMYRKVSALCNRLSKLEGYVKGMNDD